MSDSINLTTTASDVSKSPLTFDDDSRELAVIYGTLATIIAVVGLVFAALTWYASRRSGLSGHSRSPDEHDLESNMPPSTPREPGLPTHPAALNEHDLEINMAQHTAPSVRNIPVEADTGPRYTVTSNLITSALAYLQQQWKTYNTSACQHFVSNRARHHCVDVKPTSRKPRRCTPRPRLRRCFNQPRHEKCEGMREPADMPCSVPLLRYRSKTWT